MSRSIQTDRQQIDRRIHVCVCIDRRTDTEIFVYLEELKATRKELHNARVAVIQMHPFCDAEARDRVVPAAAIKTQITSV